MSKKENSTKPIQRSGGAAESKASADMAEARIPEKTGPPELVEVSLTRFAGYFLRLGTFGFGGPIALAGHMQQDLVEERHWISKQDYVNLDIVVVPVVVPVVILQ